ncbi:hypothetical protein [Telmatospirillum sp.]|uniref:hypothetical protein n=1 Tax=Telmatospirillum sp. TaxID=2079197 RepID=UPI00284D1A22|nr:hypothetical protein [Telmatospirillum sp.]MDR3440106.1 hypothetical protein [Telmatospirillum sp.]
MTEGQAQSAVEAMRALAMQIDPSIETLMEAHSFSFQRMNASANEAVASFLCASSPEGPVWTLEISHSIDNETAVTLRQSVDEKPFIALSVIVGTEPVRSLAGAIGLAVSLVTLSDQIRMSP